MSGGHLLAAGLDGGNTMIFALGENEIKSCLAFAFHCLISIWGVTVLTPSNIDTFDGGNTLILALGENAIKSRLDSIYTNIVQSKYIPFSFTWKRCTVYEK